MADGRSQTAQRRYVQSELTRNRYTLSLILSEGKDLSAYGVSALTEE